MLNKCFNGFSSKRKKHIKVSLNYFWLKCGKVKKKKKAKRTTETSLVVQWLRLLTLSAEGLDSIPCQGTRSHRL